MKEKWKDCMDYPPFVRVWIPNIDIEKASRGVEKQMVSLVVEFLKGMKPEGKTNDPKNNRNHY